MAEQDAPAAGGGGRMAQLGVFIQKYHSFLSSFVIGLAGLIATSIWQYRQSRTAAAESETQLRLAREKHLNDWKIARAEILAKNLDVLATQGAGSADRKFGVLLSLTRGNILDPELAVSYALELGKDNAYYMRSVLSSTASKNYAQLAQAFALTCLQRFGVDRDVDLCRDDRLADRSEAIAEVIREDLEAASVLGHAPPPTSTDTLDAPVRPPGEHGPLSLLAREQEVQGMAGKLAWLFEPYLQDLYEHKRWSDIDRFENSSPGARLVAALALATARTGELLSEQESRQLREFHLARRRWLAKYLFGRTCDGDCRARLVEFMLSTVQESSGDYDEVLTDLLLRPRAEVGGAVNHIHGRLLWCQIDPDDLTLLRDRVILPAGERLFAPAGQPASKDPLTRADLASLIALCDPPPDPTARARYDRVLAGIRADAELGRLFTARQTRAQRQRTSPPAMVRKVNFCGVPSNPTPTL